MDIENKPEVSEPEIIEAIKGFNRDLTCRGFKFEIGKTFEHEGPVAACASGFHSVEYPLNVFKYYAPATSIYAVVEVSGEISRHDEDTKIASSRLFVKAQINLAELIARAVKWVFDRAKHEDSLVATGYQGAASATGRWGAASATGRWGAASATGYQGAASATGDQGAASATGRWGAASATGYQGAASATGDQGVACGLGYESRAMAGKTGAIVLVHRNFDREIIHIRCSKVGENGIKP